MAPTQGGAAAVPPLAARRHRGRRQLIEVTPHATASPSTLHRPGKVLWRLRPACRWRVGHRHRRRHRASSLRQLLRTGRSPHVGRHPCRIGPRSPKRLVLHRPGRRRFLSGLRRATCRCAEAGLCLGILPGRRPQPTERGHDAAGILHAAAEGDIDVLVLLGPLLNDVPTVLAARPRRGRRCSRSICSSRRPPRPTSCYRGGPTRPRGRSPTSRVNSVAPRSPRRVRPADWMIAADWLWSRADLGFDSAELRAELAAVAGLAAVPRMPAAAETSRIPGAQLDLEFATGRAPYFRLGHRRMSTTEISATARWPAWLALRHSSLARRRPAGVRRAESSRSSRVPSTRLPRAARCPGAGSSHGCPGDGQHLSGAVGHDVRVERSARRSLFSTAWARRGVSPWEGRPHWCCSSP